MITGQEACLEFMILDKLRNRRISIPLLLGFSLVALTILAGSLPDLEFKPGESLDLIGWFLAALGSEDESGLPIISDKSERSNFLPQVGDIMLKSMIASFWLLAFFSLIAFIVSPKFRKELFRVIAMVIPMLILLPQIAKMITEQAAQNEDEQAGKFLLDKAIYPQPPDFIQNPPDWLLFSFNALLLIIILLCIFILWWKFRPRSDSQAIVVKEVNRALSELDSGLELKNVIIACYAQMCLGFQESQKIARQISMTPREFEKHLSKAGIANSHIRELTRLFEGVRYGGEQSDTISEQEARLCLQSILEIYSD